MAGSRYRKSRKQRKTRKQKKMRNPIVKQRGGNDDTNEYTDTNIYTIYSTNKTISQEQKISELNRLKESLEKRLQNGLENWLVFFAKFGNPEEKVRFQNENWVFLDLFDSGHQICDNNDTDTRILIKLDFDKQEDVKLLFEICPKFFSYMTFDGKIGLTPNITSTNLPYYLNGLKKDGILATSYKDSSILSAPEGQTNYSVKICNIPEKTVPIGRGTYARETFHKFQSVVSLIGQALRMNLDIPFKDKYGFPMDRKCEEELSYWYSKPSDNSKCLKEYENLLEKYQTLKNELGGDLESSIQEHFDLLLQMMREKFKIPDFNSCQTETRNIQAFEADDFTVLIKKNN